MALLGQTMYPASLVVQEWWMCKRNGNEPYSDCVQAGSLHLSDVSRSDAMSLQLVDLHDAGIELFAKQVSIMLMRTDQ